MFLVHDWRRTLCLWPVHTLGGRRVGPFRVVERRTWEGPGGEMNEYRMPLHRPGRPARSLRRSASAIASRLGGPLGT